MDMSNMFGKAFMNRMFRQVNDVVWDMMTGKMGVSTKEGIMTLDDSDADNPCVSLNMFDAFGMGVPAFAQNTPVDQVKAGDLLVGPKEIIGWVVSVNDDGKSFQLLKPTGTVSKWVPPKVQMLGFDSGVMVVRSLLNLLPTGTGGLGQMQQWLQMMMFMGNGDINFEKVMPMMLMTQMSAPAGTDPAASTNLMTQMMPMMMMANMMKGGGTATNMFDGSNFFDRKGR